MQSSAGLPPDDEWLGPREASVLAGLHFAKRRDDWRLGRWTAKLAVRGSGLVPAPAALADIEIIAASDGAPELFLRRERMTASLSLSHSEGMSLCVLSSEALALGCDIERIDQRDQSLVDDYFTGLEAAAIASAPAHDRALLVNLVWSAKESVLKALREGLRRDTRTVTVEWSAGNQAWNALRGWCLASGRRYDGWWTAAAGFVITMLADRPSNPPVSPSVAA